MSWAAVALHLAIILALVLITTGLWWDTIRFYSLSLAGAIYLLYSRGSKILLLRHHRNGMQQLVQQQFEEAIKSFQKSADFFTKYGWIDRFRAITFLSPSAISYKEMALINIAFCYSQLGNIDLMKKQYELALAEFPESYMAQSALNFIATIQNSPSTP
jgi:tetratricopeptide (TPR) repeat protein